MKFYLIVIYQSSAVKLLASEKTKQTFPKLTNVTAVWPRPFMLWDNRKGRRRQMYTSAHEDRKEKWMERKLSY